MRIAIVDDLAGDRALLRERLERQLQRRSVQADLLEFESGEAFLAAEREQRFTAAFLDVYMTGMSGVDAAKELRTFDTDCLLIFTTTSTDHALEGFQVRAVCAGGSDIRLCYQNILYAEHFAHVIQIHTTAGKTLATRQPFKTFVEPLKDDRRFFVCGRGAAGIP